MATEIGPTVAIAWVKAASSPWKQKGIVNKKFVKKIQSQITNVRSIKLSEMLEAASAQMEIQLKDLVDQRLTIREQEKKLEEKYKEG